MKDAIQAAAHAAMHKALPPELFSGLLAISADAVIAIDADQRIIFFNEGAEKIFGWSADDVDGASLEVLLPQGSGQRTAVISKGSAPPMVVHGSWASDSS